MAKSCAKIVLVVWIWLCLVSAGSAASPWQQEQEFSEPIFNGQFLLREAGREHDVLLLLVHGLGHEASDIWEPFVTELAQHFHVVAPDLPGFGRSTRANQLYSPANYARFIYWLMERYPDKPVYLAGHSLGGAITLQVAALHPERIERLVLMNAVGTLHRLAVSQHYVSDLIRFDLPLFSEPLESRLSRIAGMVLEKTARVPMDPDLILASGATREKFLAGDPTRIAALALVQTDFSLVLPRVHIPTWLLWGEQDQVAPLRIATLLDWNLPASRLTLLYDLGHTPMHENPQRFMAGLHNALFAPVVAEGLPLEPQKAEEVLCDHQHGRVFSGRIGQLQIQNCRNVMIVDAKIDQLTVVDSQVTIERSLIGHHTGDIAIRTLRSNLTLTGVDIRGKVGIQIDQSRLDLAGVRFLGAPIAVEGVGNPSSVLFSSCLKQIDGKLIPLQLGRGVRQGERL